MIKFIMVSRTEIYVIICCFSVMLVSIRQSAARASQSCLLASVALAAPSVYEHIMLLFKNLSTYLQFASKLLFKNLSATPWSCVFYLDKNLK